MDVNELGVLMSAGDHSPARNVLASTLSTKGSFGKFTNNVADELDLPLFNRSRMEKSSMIMSG